MDLANCDHLRFLAVSLTTPFSGSIFDGLIRTIRSQVANKMEEITLELAVYRLCDVSQWMALDNVLTRPEMVSLRRVQVKVYMVEHAFIQGGLRVPFTSFADTAKAGLRGLNARSLLDIEQISREGTLNVSLLVTGSDLCIASSTVDTTLGIQAVHASEKLSLLTSGASIFAFPIFCILGCK